MWLSLGLFLLANIILRIYLQLRRTPTLPAFGFLLKSRGRRLYRQPRETLAPLQIEAGMTVLEVGPGVGIFTPEAIRQVGESGRLICLELQARFMQQTRAAIPPACASQVKLSQADVVALPLADKTVDRAFLIAVLPLVPETQTALQQLHRVLKPGGLMLVSEELPAPEYVPRLVTERWARTAGFEVEGKIGNIFCYSLLCRKAV